MRGRTGDLEDNMRSWFQDLLFPTEASLLIASSACTQAVKESWQSCSHAIKQSRSHSNCPPIEIHKSESSSEEIRTFILPLSLLLRRQRQRLLTRSLNSRLRVIRAIAVTARGEVGDFCRRRRHCRKVYRGLLRFGWRKSSLCSTICIFTGYRLT